VSAVSNAIAELVAKRSEIDEAIAVLRRFDGNGAAPAAIMATANGNPKARATSGKRKPGTWATPETWAEVRKLYEAGTGADVIAKQLGVTKAAIYYHAAHEKPHWKRPKGAKAPAGDVLPGQVRCPSCQAWTDRDPCTSCGKKVRR
jgi:hypothetical protein